jgi:hypothetical protein
MWIAEIYPSVFLAPDICSPNALTPKNKISCARCLKKLKFVETTDKIGCVVTTVFGRVEHKPNFPVA